jgi:hypothetical protein
MPLIKPKVEALGWLKSEIRLLDLKHIYFAEFCIIYILAKAPVIGDHLPWIHRSQKLLR